VGGKIILAKLKAVGCGSGGVGGLVGKTFEMTPMTGGGVVGTTTTPVMGGGVGAITPDNVGGNVAPGNVGVKVGGKDGGMVGGMVGGAVGTGGSVG